MEQNLKKLIDYAIKKEINHLTLTYDELKEFKRIDSELNKLRKVINIINKKNVKIEEVKQFSKISDNVEVYNKEKNKSYRLTQREYNILKEVLENEK